MRCVFILVFCFLFSVRSHAAIIDIRPAGADGLDVILVFGEILAGDAERFRTVAEQTSNAAVLLSGPGGNVVAGLAIGETIRLKNFGTVVLDGDACASACALAWLGGTRRFMGERAKIGFHAAHDARSGSVSGMGNALVGAYLNRIGLPTKAVVYITLAEPDRLIWLNQEDAKSFGISVEILASTSSDDQPVSRPTASPLESEALAFTKRHFVAETTANSSNAVEGYYADVVFYYGKHMSKTAVLSEFQAFVQRWPDRDYTIRDDTVQIQCFTPTQVCNVTAIIDWLAISRERGKRSQGHSSWSLGLIRRNGAFIITSVNGEVLRRRITDLSDDPLAVQQ